MLIADAEKMIADLTRVLDPDEQAVRDVQIAGYAPSISRLIPQGTPGS